jgi:hypothetical protein
VISYPVGARKRSECLLLIVGTCLLVKIKNTCKPSEERQGGLTDSKKSDRCSFVVSTVTASCRGTYIRTEVMHMSGTNIPGSMKSIVPLTPETPRECFPN